MPDANTERAEISQYAETAIMPTENQSIKKLIME